MVSNPLITKILFLAILVALVGSIAGNYFLFNKAMLFYTRESRTRIWPLSERYAEANAALLKKAKTKTRVIIFGESRCGMWLPNHPTNWGDIEIVNRGIGGESTAQIRARIQSDVLDLDPDIVILQMGDNDVKTIAVLEDQHEAIVNLAYNNIIHIANTLRDNGIEVLITTTFPPGPVEFLRKPLWSDAVNEEIDNNNRKLLAYQSPGITVIDCDKILRDDKYIKAEYSRDTLHLNKKGYQALNEGLEATMLGLVQKVADYN